MAKIGEHIDINSKHIRKPAIEGFFINEHLNHNVMLFDIFPRISPHILHSVFSIEGLQGVILRTYGTGNAPTNDEFLREIEIAIRKGIAVVNITQCVQGMVEMGLYEASMGLSRVAVISGVDMTSEAALVKMMFLLGQGYDTETVKDQMQKNLRGEQSVNVFNSIYGRVETKNGICYLRPKQLAAGFEKEKFVKANIRFDTISSKNKRDENKPLNLAVFMNFPSADINTPVNIPQCLGIIEHISSKTDFVLECTQKVSQVIIPGRPVQLTIVTNNEDVFWDGVVFSIYTDVD